jgi:rhamnose transport system substrate-binding protein
MGRARAARHYAAFAACCFVALAWGCARDGSQSADKATIGVMPKLVGISYFTAAERGAAEAAAELGIELDYDGPTTDRVDEQAKMIDRWIAQGYDLIAVAPNDPELIAPALRRAKEAGITVVTWDADANPTASGREVFVNQAPVEEIGNTLVDILAEAAGGAGKAVIITGSATAPNQNAWMKVMRRRIEEKYPKLELLETLVSDEDQAKAYRLARDVINAHADLKGIWGITSLSAPAAAKAVRDAGKSGQIHVTGVSLPSSMREYVLDGTVEKFVLWSPVDLGYLAVHAAKLAREGKLTPGEHSIGRLRAIQVRPGEVLLGRPLVFDRENIGRYGF